MVMQGALEAEPDKGNNCGSESEQESDGNSLSDTDLEIRGLDEEGSYLE